MSGLSKLFSLAICLATALSPQVSFAQSKLRGICFSAVRDGESPALQINPLPSTVRQDVAFASGIAHSLRTYSVQGSYYLVPEFCEEFGVDCVVGAWIGKARWQNDAQVELLIRLASGENRRIRSVLVGNEVLHRGDCSPQQLTAYLRQVRQAAEIPVGTAETWKAWMEHPEVADAVDFCAVQVYPYWEGRPIEGAAAYTVERLLEMRKTFPGKKIVLSEFGWPTAGPAKGQAVASEANAARYLREILPLLEKHQFEYYYFSVWDENWKVGAEGGVGAHWGLFRSDGRVKPGLKTLLPPESIHGSKRPARRVTFSLTADEARNAEVLRVAYPQPRAVNDETTSPERGAGLQAVIGSGVRIELVREKDMEDSSEPPGEKPSTEESSAGESSAGDSVQPAQPASSPSAERSRSPSAGQATGRESGDISQPRFYRRSELDARFKKTLDSNELYGLCLSLFRDNETPHFGITPLVSELRSDIQHAKTLTGLVRTYSVTDSFSLVPELCRELKIDCLPGAALGKYPWLNEGEIEGLIRIGRSDNPHVKAVIVGNEVMHRGDFSIEQYIAYIRRVKRSVDVPVATAELLHTWMEHPELAEEVDILGVQIYPFWGGLKIDAAAEDTLASVQELQRAHPEKRVMLTEFGWPTAGGTLGDAVASAENAARYFRETIPLLNQNGIEYLFFAMTDEKWKEGDEGGPGAHWGLLSSDGRVKPEYKSLLPKDAGMSRPPRPLNYNE